jgi:hypothetical protein
MMGYYVGLRLRERPEVMYATLGAGVSLTAGNRLRGEVAAPMQALQKAPRAVPPPVVMVDGLGGAHGVTGEHREEAQGRRRAVKRKAKRVVLTVLGLWDDGHGEMVH